jgi:hypothetical protein
VRRFVEVRGRKCAIAVVQIPRRMILNAKKVAWVLPVALLLAGLALAGRASLALDTGIAGSGGRLSGECNPLRPAALLLHGPALHSQASTTIRFSCWK